MEEADEQPAAASGEALGRRKGDLEDDLDIYRDMEQSDSVGDDTVVGFLPPPPEPPRMLVDFGNDDDSCCDEDDDDSVCRRPGSGDPEVVNSPVLESEIYDPAEPCMDSDDEIPVKPVQKVLEEDIPLPPGSPLGRSEESRTNVVSYSSTDSSSGCESGSEVKSKRGGGTLSSGLVPEVPDAEGSRGRLDPGSLDCREEEGAAAAAEVVGEKLVRCPDSRLSGGTSDGERLQETDEKRVTDEFSVTDSLERLAKDFSKVCKVCSRASDVCNCGSNPAGKRVDDAGSTSSSSSCSSSSSSNSDSSSSDSSDDLERSDAPVNRKSGRDAGRRKKGKRKNQNVKVQDENVTEFQFKRDKFLTGTVKGVVAGERCKNTETDAVVGFSKASVRSTAENSLPDTAAQLGLEGLDTESISENEAFNFDDYCSRSEDDGELGELDSVPPRKKRKLRNKLAGGRQSTSKLDIFKELSGNISLPKLDWNSEDDVVKKVCDVREDRVIERKGKKYEKENVTNDGVEIGKKSIFDKKSKKVSQAEIVGNVECKDNAIPWKKISLEGKERNYRDGKMARSGEKEYHGVKGMSNKKVKKQKEKRKDIERYDVRKVLNDKRKIGDRFGRDQSREYSFSRSRSRSDHSRSRSASRSKDRYRSRSRSYKSRRRSKNKAGRKSKDSFPREKRRASKRSERSRSRNNRSRSRSWSRSRKRQERGRNGAKSSSQRTRSKRSWSRTWTPSWSRSRSGSTSSSSFSRSCSPPPRKFNRSFSHSFSRSWSREPHEHIPVPKPSVAALVKPFKKHGGVVVLAKPKDEEHHVKKGKKKKDLRVEKNKKRKERLIPPSKEVFTSGDNILVSVNFNKSTRSSGLKTGGGGDSSILGSSCLTLPSKITSKHSHLDENFEITKELGKKPKKEAVSGDKMSEEGANADGTAGDAAASKPRRKVKKSLKEDKRFAAILKQKPIAVIDLDHSPFKERTPSPTDLIVLSDSNEEGVVNNASKVVDPELKKLCLDIPSPPEKSETVQGRVPEISVTTGPKTPPEPPNESNLPLAKDKEVVTTLPSKDDSFQKELGGTDERDEQDSTCPAPQGNAVLTDLSVSSPGAYDPFDPTKSATPSPGGQDSSADTAVNMLSDSHDNPEEGNSHPPTCDAPGVPDEAGAAEVRPCEASAECVSVTNSDQGSAKDSPEIHSEVVITELKVDVNVDVNNTVVNMEIDETDGPTRLGEADGNQDTVQAPSQHQTVTTTVTQISAECSVTSVKCNEVPGIPADFPSNESKLHLASTTPVKHLQHPPHVTPPRNLAFLQLPLSTPLIHPPMLVQPNLPPPLLSTPVVSRQADYNQGLFLTSTPLAASKEVVPPPDMSNISAIASYLVSSLAVTPQIPAAPPPLLNVSDHHPGLASIPTPPAHNGDRRQQKTQDTTEVVDMDLDSPYSPASSEGDDLFEPPPEEVRPTATFPAVQGSKPFQQPHKSSKPNRHAESKPPPPVKADPLHTLFSTIAKSAAAAKPNLHTTPSSKGNAALNRSRHSRSTRKEIHIKRAADQLEILDELPSSAVELQVKEKFLKKLNRQERVVDEVKIALKPHYTKKYITKEEYKDILRRAVPKICHNEPGEINPAKVSSLVEAYVKKYRYAKKKFGSHHHGATGDKSSKNVM